MPTLQTLTQNPVLSTVKLSVLSTTDLHAQILPYDYQSDKPDNSIGLARTATLVSQIRQTTQNSILVDNGDFLQGNPFADYVALENGLNGNDTHPVIAAMNALRYDAATLGNHEFDYGVDFMTRALQYSKFPIISANILTHKGANVSDDITLIKPFVILDKTVIDTMGKQLTIRIGIIGFAPPKATLWGINTRDSQLDTRDILETAQTLVPEMKQRGADIIVALTHTGIFTKDRAVMVEHSGLDLSGIDGIDAIVSGHTHQIFPGKGHVIHPEIDPTAGTLNKKPAVMSGAFGTHLGVIGLTLEHIPGSWSVVAHHVENLPISKISGNGRVTALVASEPTIEQAAKKYHDRTLAYIRRPTGKILAPLNSYFSLLTNDRLMQFVTDAQLHYAKQSLAGSKYAELPILSASAPFKSGGQGGPSNFIDIPQGNLSLRHIAEIYQFSDLLSVVQITGHDLVEWLERSAGAFNQITQGHDNQRLRDFDFPCYYFDIIGGVTYSIDLSQPNRYSANGALHNPKARRICNLCHNGEPVTDEQSFAVATNSYRAGGGGLFNGATLGNIILKTPKTNREAIHDYILNYPLVPPPIRDIWSFKSLPNTSVYFDTGIGARNHLDTLSTIDIHDTGETINGFARFRIHL